jgi:CubicO group peptidase (beta-lactamase class C family)
MSMMVAAAIVVLSAGPGPASPGELGTSRPPIASDSALLGLDSLVDETIGKWNMPGLAISIVQDGKVILSKGYGVRDPRTGAKVTKDTYFPIASLVKAFTSVGVGMLVDDGKLEFDGPVRRYLPGFEMHDPVATHEVTIRDLLAHRSGMQRRDSYVYYKNPGMKPRDLLERLPHFDLGSRPRQVYHYSNAAYVFVGLAMEHVTGKPYEQFMEERLFQPLGMNRTTFSTPQATSDRNHAVGRWYWRGTPVHEYYDYGRIINAHGGISSTADDMAKWMLMNLSGGRYNGRQIVRETTLREIFRTQIAATLGGGEEVVPMGYAMGWNTEVYRGHATLYHNGGVNGIRTVTILIPRRNIGVTILGNEANDLPDLLARDIVDRLLGVKSRDRLGPALAAKQARDAPRTAPSAPTAQTPSPPPSHPLSDYVGLYSHPGFGDVRIGLKEGALTGEYNGHSAPLRHRHYDVFRGEPTEPDDVMTMTVQFFGDTEGRIANLTLGPYGDARFRKQPDERLSDPAHLAGLAGTYQLGSSRIRITVAGRSIIYQRDALDPSPLIPGIDGDYHHPRADDLSFAFVRDASGRATAMLRKEGGTTTEMKRIE